jgi:hypothetical protein
MLGPSKLCCREPQRSKHYSSAHSKDTMILCSLHSEGEYDSDIVIRILVYRWHLGVVAEGRSPASHYSSS